MPQKPRYELIIVGGGAVGLLTAHLIAPYFKKVALINKVPITSQNDPRFFALNHQSLITLFRLKRPIKGQPLQMIRVAESQRLAQTFLEASRFGLQHFGKIIAANELQSTFAELPNHIDVFCQHEVEGIENTLKGVILKCKTNKQEPCFLEAEIILASDGCHSSLKQLSALSQITKNQGQAQVCNFKIKNLDSKTAIECFTEHGPWALLPINQDEHQLIACKQNQEEHNLVTALHTHLPWLKGAIEETTETASFPLITTHGSLRQGRVVFLGDAAQRLHPVAGQGLNLALHQCLLLKNELLKGLPINDALLSYEIISQKAQQDAVFRTEALLACFRPQRAPAQWLRQMGLLKLNAHPCLQKSLITEFLMCQPEASLFKC